MLWLRMRARRELRNFFRYNPDLHPMLVQCELDVQGHHVFAIRGNVILRKLDIVKLFGSQHYRQELFQFLLELKQQLTRPEIQKIFESGDWRLPFVTLEEIEKGTPFDGLYIATP